MSSEQVDANWWRGFAAGALAVDIVWALAARVQSPSLAVLDKVVGAICIAFLFYTYWLRRS